VNGFRGALRGDWRLGIGWEGMVRRKCSNLVPRVSFLCLPFPEKRDPGNEVENALKRGRKVS